MFGPGMRHFGEFRKSHAALLDILQPFKFGSINKFLAVFGNSDPPIQWDGNPPAEAGISITILGEAYHRKNRVIQNIPYKFGGFIYNS
jgi:hypothetical protein